MHLACGGQAIEAVIIAIGATPEIVLTGLLLRSFSIGFLCCIVREERISAFFGTFGR